MCIRDQVQRHLWLKEWLNVRAFSQMLWNLFKLVQCAATFDSVLHTNFLKKYNKRGAKTVSTFESDYSYCTTFHGESTFYRICQEPHTYSIAGYLINSKFSWWFRQMTQVCQCEICLSANDLSPSYPGPIISRSVICQLQIYKNFFIPCRI